MGRGRTILSAVSLPTCSRRAAGWCDTRSQSAIELNEFPLLADGFQYAAQSVPDVMRTWAAGRTRRPGFDYLAMLEPLRCPCAASRAGRSTKSGSWAFRTQASTNSVMGGAGAFWCNAPPLAQTAACKRRFVDHGLLVSSAIWARCFIPTIIAARRFWPRSSTASNFLAWTYKPQSSPGDDQAGSVAESL